MLAIESRNEELVASILEHAANPFFKDALGKTAINYAQFMRDERMDELIR